MVVLSGQGVSGKASRHIRWWPQWGWLKDKGGGCAKGGGCRNGRKCIQEKPLAS